MEELLCPLASKLESEKWMRWSGLRAMLLTLDESLWACGISVGLVDGAGILELVTGSSYSDSVVSVSVRDESSLDTRVCGSPRSGDSSLSSSKCW